MRGQQRDAKAFSCVCLMGWRVTVFSFRCDGRTYSVGPGGGALVSGDHALSRFELRVCSRSEPWATIQGVGFRTQLLFQVCLHFGSQYVAHCVTHISTPLLQAINVCQSGAGVEGPEHTAARSSQLAAVRPAWWEDAVANSAAEVGSIIDVIGDLWRANSTSLARQALGCLFWKLSTGAGRDAT